MIFKLNGGRLLLDTLVKSGLDIRAAFWVKPSEENWRLYLACEGVDEKGARFVYGFVREALHNVPEWGVDASDVYVIGVSDSRAQAAAAFVAGMAPRPTPFGGAVPYKSHQLGRYSIDGAYIYPLAQPAPTGSP